MALPISLTPMISISTAMITALFLASLPPGHPLSTREVQRHLERLRLGYDRIAGVRSPFPDKTSKSTLLVRGCPYA